MHLIFWAPTTSLWSTKVSDHLQSVTNYYCDVLESFGVLNSYIYCDIDFRKVRQFTVNVTCTPTHLYLIDEFSFSYLLKLLLWIDCESYTIVKGGIFTVFMIDLIWSLQHRIYYASTSAPTWSNSITSDCWKGPRQYVEGMQRVSVHWQSEGGWIAACGIVCVLLAASWPGSFGIVFNTGITLQFDRICNFHAQSVFAHGATQYIVR